MWQSGQSRHSVPRGIENQLRPLRRTRILESIRLQTTGDDQFRSLPYYRVGCATELVRRQPGGGIQFVLDMRVAVASAAHEGCAPNHPPPCVLGNDFLAAQPVLR